MHDSEKHLLLVRQVLIGNENKICKLYKLGMIHVCKRINFQYFNLFYLDLAEKGIDLILVIYTFRHEGVEIELCNFRLIAILF